MNLKGKIILFSLLFISLISISAISANDDIAISENNDYDNLEKVSVATNFTALQKDIDENDEIILSNNVTMLSEEQGNFSNGMVINKTIAIDGNGYTIDANGLGRIFNITYTGSLTLKNTCLINGNITGDGGGIYNSGGNCVVTNCNFDNNTASNDGGAIVNSGDNCIVTNCSFINNIATLLGGSIVNSGDNCTLTNCSFIKNTAGIYFNIYGECGAIDNYGNNCVITNCSFINNIATLLGGAIVNSGDNCIVSNCSFINNIASYDGVAIDNSGDNCIVINCSFINNTARHSGGAIYNKGDNCIINDSTFSFGYGAAICNSGNCTVANCNFINNFDGAIHNFDNNCNVINCNFINNTAGGAVYTQGNCTVDGCFFDNILSNISEICLYGEYSFLRNNTFNIKENTPCIELYYGYVTSPTIAIVMNNKTENVTLLDGYNIKVVFTDDNGNSIRVHNTTNTNVIINETKYDLIDNGTYSYYNYTPKELGTYNIGASADSLTNLTVKNGTLEVLPLNLILQNLTKYYGASDKLISTLTKRDKPFVDEQIEFIVNSKHYNRTTDDNGKVFLKINLAPGVYPVTVNYKNTLITNGTVTILNTIQSSDMVKFYKNSTRYSAKFLDSKGNALANKEVKFNIHGVFYTKTTDNNGVASLAINLASGVYIITAINPVTGEQKGNNITVLSSISSQDVTLYYMNGTKYEAVFYKSEGVPLTNTKINLNINGVLYERTTDSNGIATLSINLDPAEYIITAINSVNGEMIGSKVKILPVLVGNDMDFTYDEARHYTVKSLDGQGKPLANQTIKMNINGVFYEKTTDSNGEAKLNIRLDPGEYIITSYWNTAITSNTIKIRS